MRSSLILTALFASLLGCADPLDVTYGQGLDLYAEKKYEEALPFIREAAAAGHKDGMAILGAMYLFGRGVENDAVKATHWMKSAATRGQVDAQSILGIMYATGQGVTRNMPEATKWLRMASEAGEEHATRMLRMIEGPK